MLQSSSNEDVVLAGVDGLLVDDGFEVRHSLLQQIRFQLHFTATRGLVLERRFEFLDLLLK